VYALRLYAGCPRCPGTALVEEANMPKITVSGGPSNADDPQPVAIIQVDEPLTEDDVAQLRDEVQVARVESEGGEPPSAGTSSSPSEPKPRRNTGTRRATSPPPAPTTESP
jgi:hypothetical protein